MKYKETAVSYPLPEELRKRINPGRTLINLDQGDIDRLFRNREGYAYEAVQEDESAEEFFTAFFDRISAEEQVINSSNAIVMIEFSESSPLMMKDLAASEKAMLKAGKKNLARGVAIDNSREGLAILAIYM